MPPWRYLDGDDDPEREATGCPCGCGDDYDCGLAALLCEDADDLAEERAETDASWLATLPAWVAA